MGLENFLSTYMALLELAESISKSINEKEITVGVFIDLGKVFDTVNHKIILDKLYHCDTRSLPHKWISSNLSYRKQYVSIDYVESSHYIS